MTHSGAWCRTRAVTLITWCSTVSTVLQWESGWSETLTLHCSRVETSDDALNCLQGFAVCAICHVKKIRLMVHSTGRVGLPETACLLWRLHWNMRAEHLIGLNSCPFTAIDLLWNPECQETRCFPLHGGFVLYRYLKSGFSVREIQSFPRKTGLNYAQIPSKKGFTVLDVQVGQMVTLMWMNVSDCF
jgi:hypothetical protein